MSGPLSTVSQAIASGAGTRAEIAQATGYAADVVDAALEHLQRTGHVVAEHLATGCPGGGCTACASGKADGSAGCGATAPANARGPVLLKLTQRPG